MKAILSPILPLFFFAACTKDSAELAPKCVPVAVYSDKYTADTVFLKTDTLYEGCLEGVELQKFRKAKDEWFLVCDSSLNFRIEHLRHVVNNQKSIIYIKK